NPKFIRYLMVMDECIFHTNNVTYTQFNRIWSKTNPHWILERNEQYRNSVRVRCGIFNWKLVCSYFLDGTLNGQKYLHFLQTYLTLVRRHFDLTAIKSGDSDYVWYRRYTCFMYQM
ncbi:hypothetical protein WH47_02814, partial [Habropoda laboriosa]